MLMYLDGKCCERSLQMNELNEFWVIRKALCGFHLVIRKFLVGDLI
jgi:hypothetical protein